MAIRFELKGVREFVAYFQNLPRQTQAKVRSAIERLSYQLRGVIQGLLTGQVLHVRSGNLRDNIHVLDIVETTSSVSGGVGTNTEYARIQELGGVIRAKNVANLTIPLDAVLTPAGVARYSAHDVISDPSIGGFTGTFFRNGILFGVKAGNPPTIVPLFVLRPSVALPAHPYMAEGLRVMRSDIETQIRAAIESSTEV